jgi:AcrR family transcriptional regulator
MFLNKIRNITFLIYNLWSFILSTRIEFKEKLENIERVRKIEFFKAISRKMNQLLNLYTLKRINRTHYLISFSTDIVMSMANTNYDRPLQPSQTESEKTQRAGTRRRGKILEDAVLEAAWEELCEAGFNHLTMEGVAARAKTNKAVVYRRWANKKTLVLAVLRKYLPPLLPKEVPNTGDLRNDVFFLLQGIAKPLQTIGAETIHALLVEYFSKDIISSIPQIVHPKTEGKLTAAMMTILKNAEMRGDIKLKKISPRIISLPVDLLRYELLTTHEPISDKTISEIVDDIFMPLVHYHTRK